MPVKGTDQKKVGKKEIDIFISTYNGPIGSKKV